MAPIIHDCRCISCNTGHGGVSDDMQPGLDEIRAMPSFDFKEIDSHIRRIRQIEKIKFYCQDLVFLLILSFLKISFYVFGDILITKPKTM